MKTVNIGKLKNNLSSYLRQVRNGEEVIVQDRKKPIARIVPFAAEAPGDEESRLIAAGILTPAKEELDWEAFKKLPMPQAPDGAVKEALDWIRGKA